MVFLWSFYLAKTDRHGPPFVRRLSRWLSRRLTIHQILVIFSVGLYVSRNFARLVGLESPEPLANLYARDYFRATWWTTALDAGFWTAMNLRPRWLRDMASIVFTFYYLVCAEQADDLVHRVRGVITVQHMRVSWDKLENPVLGFFTRLLRPKFVRYDPWPLTIDRPTQSDYRDPIKAWMYFDGSKQELRQQDKVVLDIPGGGFVAMNPRCHDDKLLAWAGKLGLPVLALDYQKAPESPYPFALHECYDAYYQLVKTKGRCIGLSGECVPKIIISGDSAGGNLAIGTVLLLLQGDSQYSSWNPGSQIEEELPPPIAVVGIYPALDMNIANWMTDEQMALLKKPNRIGADKKIVDRKTDDYRRLQPDTPHESDDEGEETRIPPLRRSWSSAAPQRMKTRLAMTSMISYFNDRILSPEMLRAMILLYIGPYNRPDFATDFLLSPLRAPEDLLARFPRTFLLCGERDPLSDDTAVFAGRLRQAHLQEFRRRQELGIEPESAVFDDKQHVETVFVEGISHGFLQFVSVFPRGWEYIHHCSRWMRDRFDQADAQESPTLTPRTSSIHLSGHTRGKSRESETSGDEQPLEIPSKLRMTTISPPESRKPSRKHTEDGSSRSQTSRSGRGSVARQSGRRSPVATRTRISKLSSFEDLVSRRMSNVSKRHTDNRTEDGL